jgi:uroporphyrinogen decarboxylase
MKQLLEKLAEASARHLMAQIEAGADAVQIFDSWAGVLDDEQFRKWCVAPVSAMVARIRASYPDVPIIGFPKGAGARYVTYRQGTGVTALGLDWTVPLELGARLQKDGAVQGNLDPLRLVAGGRALDEGVDAILETLGAGPLVFNLGHGITPETPVEHVERMLARIRGRG